MVSRFPHTTRTLATLVFGAGVYLLLHAPFWVIQSMAAMVILLLITASVVADLRKQRTNK